MALMPISAWVVDRLLSQSLNMRIPFHAAGSSLGSVALSASCVAAVDFGFIRYSY